MKRFSAALAACALIGSLVACGDSTGTSGGHDPEPGESSSSNGVGGSSSSNGSGNGASSVSYGSEGWSMDIRFAFEGERYLVTIAQTYPIVGNDEDNHVLTLVRGNRSEDCVVSGNDVSWRVVEREGRALRSEYGFGTLTAAEEAFVRDTLRLPVVDGVYLRLFAEGDELPAALVGGDSSSLSGTWYATQCAVRDGALDCDDARLTAGYGPDTTVSASYVFSDRSMSVTAVVGLNRNDAFAFRPFDSWFMEILYNALSRDSWYDDMLSPAELFQDDSEDVADAAADLGVAVLSRTENAQTFVLGGREYRMVVDSARETLNEKGTGFEYVVAVEVSSGGVACRFAGWEKETVDRESCKAENIGLFDGYTTKDDDGSSVFYVETMRQDNAEEFLACIKSIAPQDVSPEPAGDVAPPPAQDGRAEVSFRKALRRKLPFLPRLSPVY